MSKKESYWFSHDCNAASNPKLIALINKYGFEGYGRWWRLLERLRDCDNYKYHIGTPFAYDVLADDLHLTAEEAKAFVQDCVDYFQLLQCNEEYIWLDSLMARMEYWEKRREVLRERGRKGGKARAKKKATDNEEDVSTSEAQASNSLSTSNVKVKLKQANETIQNQTKLNETTFIIENDEQKGGLDMGMKQETLETLRNQALADGQHFVYPHVSTGRVNKEQLGNWLTAFNKWLAYTGEEVKTERDYRRHFAAWFRYRDLKTEQPETYNPAAPAVKETPAATTVPLPVVIPKEHVKTKYKKGQNQYDMHWLKDLRDDLNKIG